MGPQINVPLNTMLADLDETLKTLLKRELTKQGFDGAEIAFDAPAKEWSAALSVPTVNLFLYDLRESEKQPRKTDWIQEKENGQTREIKPALRIDASYAVTAWTREVQDEHRLLSQVLAIMFAFEDIPDDVMTGTLSNGSQRYPIRTKVAQPRSEGKADFWTSIGGQYKASLDYIVTVSCEPGTSYERGPEVKSQTIRTRSIPGGRGTIEETHRFGGVVVDPDGLPVPDAWVILREKMRWSPTNADGRFLFDKLDAGTYNCIARAPDGGQAEGKLSVPGGTLELTIGAAKTPAKRKS